MPFGGTSLVPASERQTPGDAKFVGEACNVSGMSLTLHGTDLRYVLTRLLEVLGPCSIQELCAGLERWGFAVEGRQSKTVSDALRWERRRGRVYRRDRGLYSVGWMPRSTEHRIIHRVLDLRERAARGELSLRGGRRYPQPPGNRSDGSGVRSHP